MYSAIDNNNNSIRFFKYFFNVHFTPATQLTT